MDVAERLETVRHIVGVESHIHLDLSKCEACDGRVCIRACPAGCFTLEDNQVQFGYEGCLECGTCRIICPNQAINWSYPLGGYGVSYRYG